MSPKSGMPGDLITGENEDIKDPPGEGHEMTEAEIKVLVCSI